jgi:hypothetical protein
LILVVSGGGGGKRVEFGKDGIFLGDDDGLCNCRLTCAIHMLKMNFELKVMRGEEKFV